MTELARGNHIRNLHKNYCRSLCKEMSKSQKRSDDHKNHLLNKYYGHPEDKPHTLHR